MGTNINIESNPEISTDQDEIHTATLEFTYKTHIFGGTDQKEMGVVNPYIAPVTKISTEVHLVPYLEQDSDGVERNETGFIGSSNPQESDIPNYFNKLDDGQIPYPEYEQLDWIMDYQKNPETGEWELPYDPNEPYGYEIQDGDGLTYVNHKHRLYDQEVEITPDHMRKAIQSQNYVNQWGGFPYREIETRPWSDTDIIEKPTESEL